MAEWFNIMGVAFSAAGCGAAVWAAVAARSAREAAREAREAARAQAVADAVGDLQPWAQMLVTLATHNELRHFVGLATTLETRIRTVLGRRDLTMDESRFELARAARILSRQAQALTTAPRLRPTQQETAAAMLEGARDVMGIIAEQAEALRPAPAATQ